VTSGTTQSNDPAVVVPSTPVAMVVTVFMSKLEPDLSTIFMLVHVPVVSGVHWTFNVCPTSMAAGVSGMTTADARPASVSAEMSVYDAIMMLLLMFAKALEPNGEKQSN